MEISAYMLSCPERAEVRLRTLTSLKAADWKRSPRLVIDTARDGRPQERQEKASQALLRRALNDGVEMILFMEDDLEINRHLRYNLDHWPPLARVAPGGHFYGSLYNPNIGELERHPEENCMIAWPTSVYGSQAVLLARATAAHILAHWEEVAGMQDIKMSRLAAQVCPLVYHTPSLVQHIGVNSMWGGNYHTARDYLANWKALPDRPRPEGGVKRPERLELSAASLEMIPREEILARARSVEGWLSEAEADLLLRATVWAAQLRTAALVEVGSYCGKASLVIALTLKALGSRQKLYAVDNFSGTVSTPDGGVMHTGPTFERFSSNVRSARVQRQILTLKARSGAVDWDRPVALLLIDGMHDAINVRTDFERFERWVVPGGLVAFHDCTAGFPSVQVFVKELLSSGRFHLVEQADSLAVLA